MVIYSYADGSVNIAGSAAAVIADVMSIVGNTICSFSRLLAEGALYGM